jgi:hypothetical protein
MKLTQNENVPEFDIFNLYNSIEFDFTNMIHIFHNLDVICNNKLLLTCEFIEKTITFKQYLTQESVEFKHILHIVYIIYNTLSRLQSEQKFSHNQLNVNNILLQKGNYIYIINEFRFDLPFKIIISNYGRCSTKASSLFFNASQKYPCLHQKYKNNYTDSFDLLLLENIRTFLSIRPFKKNIFLTQFIDLLRQIPEDEYFQNQLNNMILINYVDWIYLKKKDISKLRPLFNVKITFHKLTQLLKNFHRDEYIMINDPFISYDTIVFS